uniref:DUF4939 domain-containing protein n=1 Tax=Paramormyrops kingsleyae TaxID=1676925 RepID=A0A3B3RN94_9TELE
ATRERKVKTPTRKYATRERKSETPLPERYDGNPNQCRGFLMQVGIYVEEHPEMFTTPGAEVRFTISLLTGRAREWADCSPLLGSGREFHRALMEVGWPYPSDLSYSSPP